MELALPGIAGGVENAKQLLGMVAVVPVAWAIASEYGLGTMRNLLVRRPRRVTLLAGTTLVVLSLAAVAAVVDAGISVATAYAVAPGTGTDTAEWSWAEAATAAAANTALAMAGYAALGAALAIVVRSTVAGDRARDRIRRARRGRS